MNPTPQEPSALAAFLSYLIPGLGQIYQQRYGKGILFMVALLGMFVLGQAMGVPRWQNVYVPRDDGHGRQANLVNSLVMRWHYVGQFWIGAAAWPALLHYFNVITPPPEDGGGSFISTYQRTPDEKKMNDLLVNGDKTPDLGWVYTVIAGMLNILVMYDAYAGPVVLGSAKGPKDSLAPKKEAKKEGAA